MAIKPVKKKRPARNHLVGQPDPHLDRGLQQTMSSIATLERAISRLLLLRFQQDIARLYSARLYNVTQMYLPQLMQSTIQEAGPGWMALHAADDEIKDFFRGAIAMDLRQAGERTATKSILWSYTALRHFAMSHDVHICKKRGLHSLHLLPYYPYLRAHLDCLESLPAPKFSKPPQLGPITYGLEAVEHCYRGNDPDWSAKIRVGYTRLVDTLWQVAREYDVRGYGLVLRDKLTDKWCECGCSTDHLGEVCETTVREDEEECGKRPGKEREWDGRGSGVYGWNTLDEEDLWEIDLDFGGLDPDEYEGATSDMTISELMEWRYFRAEREKQQGNIAFKQESYEIAVKRYKAAHKIEPELPHYQLNLAAAYLKLNNWIEAEKACTRALGQHKSSKGYWRRAKARKMMGKTEEAIRDLRHMLKIQPQNLEAHAELNALLASRSTCGRASPKHRGNHCRNMSYDPGDDSFSSTSSTLHPAPSSSMASTSSSPHAPPTIAPPPPKLDLPFELTERDKRKLRIILSPLMVEISDIGPLTKGAKSMNSNETFAYPSWDRYTVKAV